MKRTTIHPGIADAILAAEQDPTTIRFKLPGLTQDYSDPNTFMLSGNFKQLNLQRVMEDLMAQGLSARLAEEACEGMAEFVFGRQLGEYFASNMQRI
jgi:hypothetical protein